MSALLRSLLASRLADHGARVLLTFPFWGSGLDKALHLDAAAAEMGRFGLEPAPFVALAVIAVQLAGSALVIAKRWTWLGAGALAIFTALTIPVAHRFWALDGAEALAAFHVAAEHVGLIGGLLLAATLAGRPRVSFVTVAFPEPRAAEAAGAAPRLRGSGFPRHACP